MTPPIRQPNQSIDNANCPPEIREHPLPFDECSAPSFTNPTKRQWVSPQNRFAHLGIWAEGMARLNLNPKFVGGIGGVYRVKPIFGLGLQFTTDFSEEIDALARIQTSFNLDRNAMNRGTVAVLGGVSQFIAAKKTVEGFDRPVSVTGTAPVIGGELALNTRFLKEVSFFPFLRVLYTAEAPGSLPNASGNSVTMSSSLAFFFGIGICAELIPHSP